MRYHCPLDGSGMSSCGLGDVLSCERGHCATRRGLEALRASRVPAPADWPWQDTVRLRREVLPSHHRGRALLGDVIVGFSGLVVGACLLGALAQRLERADRAAEARIEVRCGR